MYHRDVPKIVEYVENEGPDGLVTVGAFVLATIRTPLSRAGTQVADIREKGAKSAALWGWKSKGYTDLVSGKEDYYHTVVEARDKASPQAVFDATNKLLKVTGLGIPKASFLLQCLGWETGCLDSHNLRRYSLPVNFTKVNADRSRVAKYIDFCQKESSQKMWDDWCHYVAGNRMNESLPTGDDVSAYHVTAIKGE